MSYFQKSNESNALLVTGQDPHVTRYPDDPLRGRVTSNGLSAEKYFFLEAVK